MTRAAPNQPAVRAALNGLFPAALPWIVDLAATGHQNAWNAIIEQYAPMILSICHRYGLAGAEVDNVGQTVWLRLVNGLGSLRDPAALPKWLATGRVAPAHCCGRGPLRATRSGFHRTGLKQAHPARPGRSSSIP